MFLQSHNKEEPTLGISKKLEELMQLSEWKQLLRWLEITVDDRRRFVFVQVVHSPEQNFSKQTHNQWPFSTQKKERKQGKQIDILSKKFKEQCMMKTLQYLGQISQLQLVLMLLFSVKVDKDLPAAQITIK